MPLGTTPCPDSSCCASSSRYRQDWLWWTGWPASLAGSLGRWLAGKWPVKQHDRRRGCGTGVCGTGAFSTLTLLDLSAAAQGCSSAWWQQWWRPQSAAAARRLHGGSTNGGCPFLLVVLRAWCCCWLCVSADQLGGGSGGDDSERWRPAVAWRRPALASPRTSGLCGLTCLCVGGGDDGGWSGGGGGGGDSGVCASYIYIYSFHFTIEDIQSSALA